ncbi:MAG: ATP-binding cassette domain-containing protein, partial [Spirochaetales bacterium]|nr:ATP-binding cassette domain-containing protein [Spirochaetales bacterium]
MYKWFDATQALKGVDLEIQGGQIHGLIGENGSGKSTITSIIAGVKMPTEGRMFFKGQPWEPSSMASAFDCGVSMILQEANTIPGCTVAENLYAGHISKFRKYGFLDSRKMVRKASEKLADFGVSHIDAAGLVDQYGFEDRKVVEIVRSLSSSTELLIIDETTTALSHEGRKMLYSIMHKMKEEGKAVIFISHDIDEIIEHCTNLTVLRDGEITGHLSYEDLQKDDAIERIRFLMVGRDIGDAYYREDYDSSHEEEIALEFKDVSVSGVKNFNLQLHKGEIIGFGGLSGSGMHEIGRAAFGLEKLASGKVIRNEKIIKSPHDAIRGSIGYISKDRDVEALILSGDVRDNIALPSLDGL